MAKRAVLYPGRNWLALPGAPINPTVSNVFGYGLPAGGEKASSTWVDLYDSGSMIAPTVTFWLGSGSPNSWQWSAGGSGAADQFKLPVDQGFMVNIPSGSGAQYLALVGALRTNKQTCTIAGGGALTFVSVQLPGDMHPKDLGLVESGFKGAARPMQNPDLLYIWDRSTQSIYTYRPMWYKSTESAWYWLGASGGGAPVKMSDSERPISQDDAILIYTYGASYTWTNNVYYVPPTSDMSP